MAVHRVHDTSCARKDRLSFVQPGVRLVPGLGEDVSVYSNNTRIIDLNETRHKLPFVFLQHAGTCPLCVYVADTYSSLCEYLETKYEWALQGPTSSKQISSGLPDVHEAIVLSSAPTYRWRIQSCPSKMSVRNIWECPFNHNLVSGIVIVVACYSILWGCAPIS